MKLRSIALVYAIFAAAVVRGSNALAADKLSLALERAAG